MLKKHYDLKALIKPRISKIHEGSTKVSTEIVFFVLCFII